MKIDAGQAVFSPSDLNHFLECEHLIQLELRRGDSPKTERDAHAELLAQKGLDHEAAWLQRFRDEGRRIVTIGRDPQRPGERDWDRDAADTVAAMRDGADVIYQGVFVRSVGVQPDAIPWRGIADFVVRTPSGTYEAWDTKLARSSKPYFVLQLCFYTEQIGRIQGVDPEHMHIVLGTGETNVFRYDDFAAYYRAVRRRFLQATRAGLPTYPYPVAHCALCHYQRDCQDQWDTADHLSQLAGITREQVERLNAAGVTTVTELGKVGPALSDGPGRIRIGAATLDRLQHQARLQSHHRQSGTHTYELLPVDERTGFRLLPQPSEGDIFFDMEGDPYFEPAAGLEYLFGAVTRLRQVSGEAGPPVFTCFQALTRDEEKRAFEQFIDWVHARLTQWPDLHVYHYAAYEITALKRLMSTYATREDELDDLLRREVFVDLYQVVRQSLRISHNSYSIKKVRTFFMRDAGKGPGRRSPGEGGSVTDGGDSIVQFERFRQTGDPSLLQAIIDYNREDCVSTVELRDWLLGRRAEVASDLPWKTTKEPETTEKREAEDAKTRERIDALSRVGAAVWTRQDSELLAHLLNYHRREAKSEWWAFFARQKKGLDELLDDTQAISWLAEVPGASPVPEKQSLVYTLGFPDQEFKLAAGAKVIDPFTGKAPGDLESVNATELRLRLKRGKKRAGERLPAAVCAGSPIDDAVQRAAVGRVADAVIAGEPTYGAVRALLARARPNVLDVHALDHSYLFIQGPPGSGKTWTGARLIVSLLASGKRVGVAANSHKAINNLLEEVERVAVAEGVHFQGLKKGSGDDAFGGRLIRDTSDNAEIESSFATAQAAQGVVAAASARQAVQLIAGTAWLFSRDAMDQSLDYLFIDEAGQVSLADTVAMGTAARNLVLLGDPQQLPQVRQGIHPAGSGVSVLEHLLAPSESHRSDGSTPSNTVADDRGVFLAQTWRMHPDICRFVSDLSYDGRLASAPGRERQRVESSGLRGSGLRYIGVEHTGNAQHSQEEAEAVAAEVEQLLNGGTFTDHEGRTRPLDTNDILVVAPYNMHVRCLKEKVPQGVDVGTVDKFQGREAPVVFFSMASSTGQDVPRGLEFLFNRNRFNVAISRARALAVVVSSPRLMDVKCQTVDQMRLANMLCRYVEAARA
jgi:predicted RecB family nuclease